MQSIEGEGHLKIDGQAIGKVTFYLSIRNGMWFGTISGDPLVLQKAYEHDAVVIARLDNGFEMSGSVRFYDEHGTALIVVGPNVLRA